MNRREIGVRALKAAAKGILLYVLYLILSSLLAPLMKIVPTLQQSIEDFVTVYLILMVVGDFMAGTIYHYFFGAGKALFVIFYLILSLKGGVVSASFESISFLVDLRLFFVIAMLLSLLGLARSVFQAINFMSERANLTEISL